MAGVSVATVSRALSAPNELKAETYQRVMQAIRALNYKPNLIARALSVASTKTISIVVPNILNGSIANIVQGCMEELARHEYSLLVLNSSEDFQREIGFCQLLNARITDGVIFVTGSGEEPLIEELKKEMPVVFVDRKPLWDDVDYIVVDDRQGMGVLLSYLVGLGHTRIGLIMGRLSAYSTQVRAKAFREAAASLNIEVPPRYIVPGDWTMEGGMLALERLVSLPSPPTAIIAITDHMALGALYGAYRLGIKVPQDLSIVGFDDAPTSRFTVPPLTTLKYPHYKLGVMAARTILKRLQQPCGRRVQKILALELLERQSAGPAP